MSGKLKISAIVITLNEENNIESCLDSLKWADELIIVDDKSSDRTIDIANKYTDRIFIRKMVNGFAAQRNFAIDKASNEWIIFVDADEIVTEKLKAEIEILLNKQPDSDAYMISRKVFVFGKNLRYGGAYPDYHTRMIKKGAGYFKGSIHEGYICSGKVGYLNGDILHFSHPTISDWLKVCDRQSNLDVTVSLSKNEKFRLYKMFIYPIAFFLRAYILKCGFRDGIYGFFYWVLSSFYFFIKYAKLKELSEKHK